MLREKIFNFKDELRITGSLAYAVNTWYILRKECGE